MSTARRKGGRGRGPIGQSSEAADYLCREWSWLAFNLRVQEEAETERHPLLERLKFCAIVSANLDEFFMVRVARLRRQLASGLATVGPDGLTPSERMAGIRERAHALVARQNEQFEGTLRPALASHGLRLACFDQLAPPQQRLARRLFEETIFPVLTPMAVGPGHPFPNLLSGRLYLALALAGSPQATLYPAEAAFVEIPPGMPRFVRFDDPDGGQSFLPLEEVVLHHLGDLFPGHQIVAAHAVRVTRDSELAIEDEPDLDLPQLIQKELVVRRRSPAVRLEHEATLPADLCALLRENHGLADDELYPLPGRLQLSDLWQIYDACGRPDLKFPPLRPLPLTPRRSRLGIFDLIRRKDRLLYHPYQAFDPVVRLVEEAAADPQVLAIKQTLYRTSGDSSIIRALTRAAEAGKQVTVLVELRARFDEERNIGWAHRLEQAGAHVIYGLVGLKTHCKALLVVRREKQGIARYLHLGTGNYNDRTARVYTDFGLMTCDSALAEDASSLFNVITGYSQPPAWNKIEIAPTGLRQRLTSLIQREIDKSSPRGHGRIVAKVNALVDREIISSLYRAARAGVHIDLIVRGVCCLRPGVPGLSERIRVRSIVGRFLEHARVFYFRNGGDEEYYLSSADLMTRNLDRRIELLFPVQDPDHRHTLAALLDLHLRDSLQARELGADGSYTRVEDTAAGRARLPGATGRARVHGGDAERGQQVKKRRLSSQDAAYDLLRRQLAGEPRPRPKVRFVPLSTPGRRGRAARPGPPAE